MGIRDWFSERLAAFLQQPLEFRLVPEGREIEPVRQVLFEGLGIPVEIQFADPVIGQCQLPRAWVLREIQIGPLHDN